MGTPNNKSKLEMKKGPWTRDEDQKLLAYIQQHGHGSWRTLPDKAGLERCGKSCRLRWTNYLRPDIKRGKFSSHEEKSIIRLHALLGNRWSGIAAHLPNRTDNEIKNYWNTRLKKRLTRMGIDPATHKPKNTQAGSARAATLSHMAQWETARLEAEARLARQSSLQRVAAPLPTCLKLGRASGCFFKSAAGTVESPTSTLNFSCSHKLRVPTVSPVKENEVVVDMGHVAERYTEMRGEMGNSAQDDDVFYPVSYACDMMMIGPMDHTTYNDDSEGNLVGPLLGEYESSYWNELLHLVNSSPTL